MPDDPIRVDPVPIHLASVEPGIDLAGPRAYKACRTVFRTVRLIAADPVQEIVPASEDREIAWVQALDDDIILSERLGDGQTSTGAIVPKINTAPYPVRHDGVVYASAITFSGAGAVSRVSVTAVYRS